jgi:hypothetical protein
MAEPLDGDLSLALTQPVGGGRMRVAHAGSVRRLMPVECERLTDGVPGRLHRHRLSRQTGV